MGAMRGKGAGRGINSADRDLAGDVCWGRNSRN